MSKEQSNADIMCKALTPQGVNKLTVGEVNLLKSNISEILYKLIDANTMTTQDIVKLIILLYLGKAVPGITKEVGFDELIDECEKIYGAVTSNQLTFGKELLKTIPKARGIFNVLRAVIDQEVSLIPCFAPKSSTVTSSPLYPMGGLDMYAEVMANMGKNPFFDSMPFPFDFTKSGGQPKNNNPQPKDKPTPTKDKPENNDPQPKDKPVYDRNPVGE